MNLQDIATGTTSYSFSAIRADLSTTRDIQNRLISWRYNPGPVDGDWGSRTETVYMAFAKDYQHPQNSVTPRAARQLLSFPLRGLQDIARLSTTYSLDPLRDNPLIVRDLQQRLTAWGFQPGPIDGLWRQATQVAYAAFAKTYQFLPNQLSPQMAQQLLSLPTQVEAPAPQPSPAPTPVPQPAPKPVTPTNSMNLRDIATGTTSYSFSVIRANLSATSDIQKRLISWGYSPGPADGDWGSKTQVAYIAFAKAYQHPQNSVTPRAASQLLSLAFRGLQDIARLSTTYSLDSLRGNPLIVRDLQQRLTAWSFQPGPIDGLWGQATQAAYEAFAKTHQFLPNQLSPKMAQQLLSPPTKIETPAPAPKPPTPTPTPTPVPTPPDPVDAPDSEPLPRSLGDIRRGKLRWPIARISLSQSLTQAIQQALTAMGHRPGTIDGLWGNQTQEAYESFALVYGANLTSLSPRIAKLLLEPEVPGIQSLVNPAKITPQDYREVAALIGCNVPTIQAVIDVEAAGSGFFGDGRPKILFEAHWFSAFTDSRHDFSNPDISSPVWNRLLYIGGVGEWDRLYKALVLNRQGALKSASWGLGQVMGFNHQAAGYADVELFVSDMHLSEGKQLRAMFNFIKTNGLDGFLVRRDWAGFALRYNGEGYRLNRYDEKLAEAYDYWSQVA
jgi:hypothetical protein